MAESPANEGLTRVAFPNAKVNLGLQVRNRRKDGYHNIEGLFLPVPWQDTLELEVLEAGNTHEINSLGLAIPGAPEDNLIIKAAFLLQKEVDLPPMRFHLIKSIPMGAGLGGGSANGAFALKLINEHFNLGLDHVELEAYAARLGSDCPFFIQNVCAHVSGRGERVRPMPLQIEGWWIALLNPGIHIRTADAFNGITPNDDRPGLGDWKGTGPTDWTGALQNDFTKPVAEQHPAIQEALDRLTQHGATFADMSGSGSTVFGFFQDAPPPELMSNCPAHWRTWQGQFT